jgi:hypothetical protein
VVHGGDLGGVHEHPADQVEQREDGGHEREAAVDRASLDNQRGQQRRTHLEHQGHGRRAQRRRR